MEESIPSISKIDQASYLDEATCLKDLLINLSLLICFWHDYLFY